VIWAPLARAFPVAAQPERAPRGHLDRAAVRFLDRSDRGGTVEMAAWRPFGLLRYPVWWVSEMAVDRTACEVRYRHVRGITAGMSVVWRLVPHAPGGTAQPEGVLVTVVHEWQGPGWPLIGPLAASLVIGPVFIHGIASRTLAGIKRELEGATTDPGPPARGERRPDEQR